jgi:dTDP-4-dehydrorhamnose reductase
VFPHILAGICSRLGIKLIHASTDCVFSGKDGNYNEKYTPDETKIYGLSKRLGEPENCCIIRTSIIGEQIKHKYSLLEFVKSKNGQSIQGYTDHYWNGITCLQFAKSLDKIIRKNLYWVGVKHIFSPDVVSKYDLVQMISKTWGIDMFIEPVTNGHCDKTLTTIHGLCNELHIPPISKQLNELQQFNILQ